MRGTCGRAVRAVLNPQDQARGACDPVKGTYCRGPRRLCRARTCPRLHVGMVCVLRIWSVPLDTGRTGSPCLHRAITSVMRTACFGLGVVVSRRVPSVSFCEVRNRCEACSTKIRPTDFCHPTCTCLPAPALVALVLPLAAGGLARQRDGSRDTTFHDVVVRFHRTARSGPRVFAEVASCGRASDTPVARS